MREMTMSVTPMAIIDATITLLALPPCFRYAMYYADYADAAADVYAAIAAADLRYAIFRRFLPPHTWLHLLLYAAITPALFDY